MTNVIDITRFLTSGQRKRMDQQLAALEKETGVKLRVLCQRWGSDAPPVHRPLSEPGLTHTWSPLHLDSPTQCSYPDTPGLAIKDYWGVDDKTVVLVADKGPSDSRQIATRECSRVAQS
jgi:hypothetical protein